jgi:ABC-type multidrug transport system fused ATPase/permease subunit
VAVLGEQSAGELLDRVDDDTNALGRLMRNVVWAAGRLVLAAPFLWAVAGLTWWPVWFIFPLMGVAGWLAVRGDLAEVARRKVTAEVAWTGLNSAFEEAVAARNDIRTSLGQHFVLRRLAELSAAVQAKEKGVLRVEIRLLGRAGALLSGVLAGVLMVGVALVTHGNLGVSGLVTLFMATTTMVSSLSELIEYLPPIQEGIGALTRIRQLLDAPREPEGGLTVPPGDVSVEFRGLTFQYPVMDEGDAGSAGGESDAGSADDQDAGDAEGSPGDEGSPGAEGSPGTHRAEPFALRDITLTIPARQTVALVGRTGSGKTTLGSLLSRALEPEPETLFIGGRDITTLDLQNLRSTVGVVTQRTEILSATVRENITLLADLPDAVVDQAVNTLGLREWVSSLPQGLDTLLGPGGTALSAGEEQLVAFARLLVSDTQIVVLDEATARMDPLTESLVVRASRRLLRERTGVVIAHRLSTIERADMVAVLDHGRVVECGPQADLARSGGAYASLLTAASTGVVTSSQDAGEDTGVKLERGGTEDAGTGTRTSGACAEGAREIEASGAETGRAVLGGPGTSSVDAGGASAAEPGTDEPSATLAGGRRMGQALPLPQTQKPIGLLRAVYRQFMVRKRWGLLGAACFTSSGLAMASGPLIGFLWGLTVARMEHHSPVTWLVLGITLALVLRQILLSLGIWWYPLWWNELTQRVCLVVTREQTQQHRLAASPAGEVVARALDADRFVSYADRWIDFLSAILTAVITAALGRNWLIGVVFLGVIAVSAASAAAGRPIAGRSAKAAADSRARFGRYLVSSLNAIRTVKLAARTEAVRHHLGRIDLERVRCAVTEHRVRAVLDGVPITMCHAAAALAWVLFYHGLWDISVTLLVTNTALGFVFYGIVSAAVVNEYPGARAWQLATAAYANGSDLITIPDGYSLLTGESPAPPASPPQRQAFHSLELRGVTTVFDDDATVGVSQVDLTVKHGELVLFLGRVGSGKSSLLSALAGLTSYHGEIRWNGSVVDDPQEFLRPHRVAYVSQLPKVVSGSYADNIRLDHQDRDLAEPLRIAHLSEDVEAAGGVHAMIGHGGIRLSGGQAQRLALARALACRAAVLVADDISSALDARTEIEVWDALRQEGSTVIGSSSKAAALARADRVVVLVGGDVKATGHWGDLAPEWSHLAS